MKNRALSLALALIMCLSLLPTTALAADTPSSWAQEQVTAAINAGLVPQTLQSQYTQTITRAEFTALAVAVYEKVTGREITERTKFNDTTDINVEKAAGVGIVSGTGNNNFSPNTGLTREQAATMLSRLADAVSKPLTKQAATFADNGDISSWALEAVGQIQAAGIMGGVGNNTFAPKNDYTREQSIITVLRLYDVVKTDNNSNTEVTGIAILSRHRDYDDNARLIPIDVSDSAFFDIVVYPVEIAEKYSDKITITLSNETIGNIEKVKPMRTVAIDSIKFIATSPGTTVITVSCEGFNDSFTINVSGTATPTPTPTMPDTNHPLYEGFPVPDFGAIFGVKQDGVSTSFGITTYSYLANDVREAATARGYDSFGMIDLMRDYEGILKECGYISWPLTSGFDGTVILYYRGYGYLVNISNTAYDRGTNYVRVSIQKAQ